MLTDGILQSWKQISQYVGRTERTLQRWEQEFGFPVHRPSGKSRSSVMALPQEIREWTCGKPSLVQIRRTPRLNRTKLVEQPEKHDAGGDPKQNGFPCRTMPLTLALVSVNGGKQRAITLESRLRLSTLLGEQRSLRETAANLRKEQKSLCEKLQQIVSRSSFPSPLSTPR